MSSKFCELSVIGLFSLPTEGATVLTRTESLWAKRQCHRPTYALSVALPIAQGYKGVAVVRDCFIVTTHAQRCTVSA